MAETVKRGEFIELDYIGRIKSNNKIFDLTIEKVAKEEGVFQENQNYGPLKICLGANHLLKGMDIALEGREIGKEFDIEIQPQDAFGTKNPNLIQLTGLKIFKDKNINPVPGLQFSVNGALATIRSVNGGRVMLDFNHPLSGKILKYWVKINRKITDEKEKAESLVYLTTGLSKDYNINLDKDSINIELPELKENQVKSLEEQIKKLITDKKKITISKVKPKETKEKKEK